MFLKKKFLVKKDVKKCRCNLDHLYKMLCGRGELAKKVNDVPLPPLSNLNMTCTTNVATMKPLSSHLWQI